MIRRLYVHNFRCLENFDLKLAGHSSVLLIGKNGSGKTTVSLVLEILQRIGRGENRFGMFIKPKDFTSGRSDVPMRFLIEIELNARIYEYVLALELPEGFKELLVFGESLTVDGKPVYTREFDQARLVQKGQNREAELGFDRQMAALPLFGAQKNEPLYIFRKWLADMLILRPTPSLILGDVQTDTLWPNPSVVNFGSWLSGLLANEPAAYNEVSDYLKRLMPDLKVINKPTNNMGTRNWVAQFSYNQASTDIPFEDLSDGEKCFMICAVALAANRAYGPLLCFWDEPDNYLSPDEVQHFVIALRQAFKTAGQFIATSHNPEAIRSFSDENTLFLHRRNHLEPTIVRSLEELRENGSLHGDLIGALTRGDVEP